MSENIYFDPNKIKQKDPLTFWETILLKTEILIEERAKKSKQVLIQEFEEKIIPLLDINGEIKEAKEKIIALIREKAPETKEEIINKISSEIIAELLFNIFTEAALAQNDRKEKTNTIGEA